MKAARARNAITALAIALTTALFTSLFTIAASINYSYHLQQAHDILAGPAVQISGWFVRQDDSDLAVEKGEFAAVVGTSGSGKSTLLHMLGGLDRPTSGSVIVDGRDLSTLKDSFQALSKILQFGKISTPGS